MAGPIFGCSQDSAFVGAGAVFGAVQLSLSWQVQYSVKLQSSSTLSFRRGRCNIWCRSLFVAGAVLGEVAVKLHAQFSWQVQNLVQVTFRGRCSTW